MNNVISLATVPIILDKGAAVLSRFRSGPVARHADDSTGGQHQVMAGWSRRAFGMTLREAIYDFGGGTASGRPLRAVQVGGPLGAYFPESLLDTPLDYEAFTERKGLLGHGGIVVFDDTVDLAQQARFAMEFCAIESCGKCTPCRIGSTRGVEVIDRIIADQGRDKNLELLDDLCELYAGRLAVRAGRLDALSGVERARALSRRFRSQQCRADQRRLGDTDAHASTETSTTELPRGNPTRWSRSRSTAARSRCRAARRSCGRRWMPASRCRNCAPPIIWSRSVRAVSAWWRSKDGRGTPASCTTPAEAGMKVRTQIAEARQDCGAA